MKIMAKVKKMQIYQLKGRYAHIYSHGKMPEHPMASTEDILLQKKYIFYYALNTNENNLFAY